MAEHTYKPGDVVSVRTRLVRDDEPGFGFPGTLPQFTFRDIEPEYARWLSDEDQDSLLRVVKAAMRMQDERDRYMSHRQMDGSEGYDQSLGELAGALAAISPEILARVARLSEGE